MMNEPAETLFEETQHFGKWLFILLGAVYLIIIIPPLLDAKYWVVGIMAALFLLVAAPLWFYTLKTRITPSHLLVSIWPVKQRINIEDIAEWKIRTYKPIQEYGGWGIRFGISQSGTAYNTRGNVGLQLKLKSGKKILIGTQRASDLEAIMTAITK